jgi:hypothetical protein
VNATSPKHTSDAGSRMCSDRIGVSTSVRGMRIASAAIATQPIRVGTASWLHSRSRLVLRQAMSGATPARNTRLKPSGIMMRLKNGGPTVLRVPFTASDRVGNMVENRTKKAQPSSTQLLSRKANSREMNDSKVVREASWGSRNSSRPTETTSTKPMNRMNRSASWLSSPKAWTDCTTPDRVMNVPNTVKKKVMMTRNRFHTFIIPRCSWIMMEWRNAVAVNHGMSPAFSTGSQAQ